MALAAITRVVQDEAGNAVTGASVEIRSEISGAPLVSLYSDRDGAVPISNPFTAATAMFTVYTSEAKVRIDITQGILTATERDFPALSEIPGADVIDPTEVTSGASYNMLDADDIILVNKTVGSATTINLVSAVGHTQPIQIVDGKGDASTNPITIDASGTETILGQLTYQINFDYGSITLYPNQNGSWFA